MSKKVKFKAQIAGTNTWIIGLPYSVYSDNDIDSIQALDGEKIIDYIKTDTLSEFTGLEDKNGIEIYEGHILKYTKHSGYLMDDCLMTVCFDDDNACFGYKSNISMFPEYIFSFSNHDELKSDVLSHCEIIGNIFDNPELINGAV